MKYLEHYLSRLAIFVIGVMLHAHVALANIDSTNRVVAPTLSAMTESTLAAAIGNSFTTQQKQEASSHFAQLPLAFEKNLGQVNAKVKYLSRGPGFNLFLTDDEAVLVLDKAVKGKPAGKQTVLRMRPSKADRASTISALDVMARKSNYFRGKDPKQWRHNVPNYRKVRYQGVYPGVDLVYYGNPQKLEYDFVVAPGADPSPIGLQLAGVDAWSLKPTGEVLLSVGDASLSLHAPRAYQIIDGKENAVSSHYVLDKDYQLRFALGKYDGRYPLIIDPVLVYSSYLGGSGEDEIFGVALDSSDNVIITGYTGSVDFPGQGPQANFGSVAGQGVYVAKFGPDLKSLLYTSYFGGTGYEYPTGIKLDASNNVYISGETQSTDFSVTAGAFQTVFGGGNQDGFVVKLSPDGASLLYGTYLGTETDDTINDIAVDGSGNAYVTGITYSVSTFPTTAGAFQTDPSVLSYSPSAAFVTKLSPDGSSLVYSSLLGDWDLTVGNGIAVDATGSAYVVGNTQGGSIAEPIAANTFYSAAHSLGLSTIFVVKYAPNGSTLSYASLIGVDYHIEGFDLAVYQGKAHIVGRTRSADFPTTADALYPNKIGSIYDDDAVYARLSTDGKSIEYATYLGGEGSDDFLHILTNAVGEVYLSGSTQSPNIVTTADAFQPKFLGQWGEGYIAKLSADGRTLQSSTYYGACNGWNDILGMVIDSTGALYVGGLTDSPVFPVVNPLQSNFGGFVDGFLGKIVDGTPGTPLNHPPTADAGVDQTVSITDTVNMTAAVTLDGSGSSDPDNNALSYTWTGSFGTVTGATPTLNLGVGTYTITLTVDDGHCEIATDTVVITVVDGPVNSPPIADAGPDQTLECTGVNTNVVLDGSGTIDPDGDPLNYLWTGDFGSVPGVSATVPLGLGSHIIDLLVDDGISGGSMDSVNILVQDTTPPVWSISTGLKLPMEATSINGARFLFGGTGSDLCSHISVTQSHQSPVWLPVGTTIITSTATDSSGNSTTSTLSVTVVDTTPPVLTVPPDVTVDASGVGTAVDIGNATATDIFPITITNDAPSDYPVGVSVVTWTATDANGNSTTGTQKVTVTDAAPAFEFFADEIWDGATERVSVRSVTGAQANNNSIESSLSADGRFVAFTSNASNLLSTNDDTNAVLDVFVRDRESGTTERVSVDNGGLEGAGSSRKPSISADGRFVAYQSLSALVPEDGNGDWDIYVFDRSGHSVERISSTVLGSGGIRPSISADGRYIAFQSQAALTADDTDTSWDIYVYDRSLGAMKRVSATSLGSGGINASISGDGRYVAYQSSAALTADDVNSVSDIYVYDLVGGMTERVSVSTDGASGEGGVRPSINEDGQVVAFDSPAALVMDDNNGYSDVYVHDRGKGVTERVSVRTNRARQGNNNSIRPSISANGLLVAFESLASSLVVNDTNNQRDIFVHNRLNNTTERVNVTSGGRQTQYTVRYIPKTTCYPIVGCTTTTVSQVIRYPSFRAALSADGKAVAFDTNAADLVPNDTNLAMDVFVHNQQTKRGEGGAIDFTGTITDPDSVAWTGIVDFGDGSAPEPVVVDSSARTFTFSHTFPDNADYTLTVTITDAEGVSAAATGLVTITNVAPTVNAGGDAITEEGSGFTSAGSISDPGAHDDPFSGEVDYGDGNGWESLTVSGNAFVLAHTYADNGSYKVSVRITDKDGGVGTGVMTVTVNNAVPVVNAGSDVVINEGDTYTQIASFTDAGINDGPWEAWVSYGDPNDPGTVQVPITGNTFNLSHLYKDNGVYKAIISVTDKDGGTGFVIRKITVNNVAPSFVTNYTYIVRPSRLALASSFSDPGVLDTFSASIDWGDGAVTANALVSERVYATYSYGIAGGSHQYTNVGTFNATLTVTDDDGGVVQRSATVVCTRPSIAVTCTLN